VRRFLSTIEPLRVLAGLLALGIASAAAGDLHHDGALNDEDRAFVGAALTSAEPTGQIFLGDPGWAPDADLNFDGVIDEADLNIVSSLVDAGGAGEPRARQLNQGEDPSAAEIARSTIGGSRSSIAQLTDWWASRRVATSMATRSRSSTPSPTSHSASAGSRARRLSLAPRSRAACRRWPAQEEQPLLPHRTVGPYNNSAAMREDYDRKLRVAAKCSTEGTLGDQRPVKVNSSPWRAL